jgi:hypothetical protein
MSTQDLQQLDWKRGIVLAQMAWIDYNLHRFDLIFRQPKGKRNSLSKTGVKQDHSGFITVDFDIADVFRGEGEVQK